MTKQPIVATILAALLVAPECLSKTVTLNVDWDQARAIWEHGDFRQSVKVRLHSSQQLRGKLAGITASGIHIQKRLNETKVARDQVREIRLFPRRPSSWNGRLLSIVGGIPAGLAAAYGALVLFRVDIDRSATVNDAVVFSAWGATQYLLYRLGAKADRGALVLLLPATDSAEARRDPIKPSTPQEE